LTQRVVHYALIDLPTDGQVQIEIRRVEHGHEAWSRMIGAGLFGRAGPFVPPGRCEVRSLKPCPIFSAVTGRGGAQRGRTPGSDRHERSGDQRQVLLHVSLPL
jgi:hypothetical protein